jgi:LmbE family N-acetylglucosaminyl deacetylase
MASLRSLVARLERLAMGRKAYKWVLRDWQHLGDLRNAATLIETMRFSRQIEPQQLAAPAGRRILVVAPHPDDEVIGPGGTLLRAIASGADVHVVYVTTGLPEELPARRQEAEAVCRELGVECRFLDEEIFNIRAAELASSLAAALRSIRPDTVFIPFLLDDNDDHRRVNEALARCIRDRSISAGAEIWAYQVYTPLPGNVVVDVTDQAGRKAELIRLYAGQMARRDWVHFALGLNAFNCRLVHGVPDARYFESFFVVPAGDYAGFCDAYFCDGATYYETGYGSGSRGR